ncbi:MAG: 1-(5-phosphoribosyl)-5-[(5-phosphoribosylamino)methylideneamino]imidazole-4-carboxamide isomerase [Clostridia bacterium]|nr:1-(5-phosphoribosyl)-5-[(5-phosphoribosylamino)methylideneamino]imidazole-4-carboxamide isomerase [Clostridia bacterium]
MKIFPAIDLRAGKCVRLVQGKLDQETVFADNPVEMAKAWESKGAEFLHLVDLDGAFSGKPQNLGVIREIVANVNIPVQLGGGIRVMEVIEEILELGVARVILGTVAIGNPRLVESACRQYPGKIVVGIDSKDGKVAVEGWDITSEREGVELALEMKKLGVERIIYTDIKRDGMLTGPNLAGTKDLAERTGMQIIASGGISCLEDIVQLKKLEAVGIEGVIVGKALYTHALKLEDALKAARGEEGGYAG